MEVFLLLFVLVVTVAVITYLYSGRWACYFLPLLLLLPARFAMQLLLPCVWCALLLGTLRCSPCSRAVAWLPPIRPLLAERRTPNQPPATATS